MNLVDANRVLVLCAHTDDEFGCAGTMARLHEGGALMRYVALSRCEESVPPGFGEDCLELECRASVAALGVSAENITIGRFRVRRFPEFRQDILEFLVALRKEFRPDVVLLPTSDDTHQDHATLYAEGFRAFKASTVLGYELPQNLIRFENSAFVRLTEQQVNRKVAALAHYKSQEFRPYAAETFIRSLAHVRGVQAGAQYAEAFEVVRVVT